MTLNIETPITLSNRYETIRSIFFTTDDSYSCNHAEWEYHLTQKLVVLILMTRLPWSMPNADQCRSKLLHWSLLGSMPQFRSALIGIDRYWSRECCHVRLRYGLANNLPDQVKLVHGQIPAICPGQHFAIWAIKLVKRLSTTKRNDQMRLVLRTNVTKCDQLSLTFCCQCAESKKMH